jgi:hypothetical protein
MGIMRTTVSISDQLLERAKARAVQRGTTLGRVLEDALRHEFSRPEGPERRRVIPVRTGGSGPRPGIDLTSNRALNEALDEDRPLDKLR